MINVLGQGYRTNDITLLLKLHLMDKKIKKSLLDISKDHEFN